MTYPIKSKHLLILKVAVAALFLGRAWQHLVWDAPYRALLWDEKWMKGWVTSWSDFTWEEFITSMPVDDSISTFVKCMGAFYLLCFFISLTIEPNKKWKNFILIVGSGSLLFLSFLYSKEKFFSAAQFFEYTIQWSSPLLLIFALRQKTISTQGILLIKLAIALTFTAHGLYALNLFPCPGYFVEMTMNILGVGEEQAFLFLKVAGVLDLVLSLGIFLPFRFAKYFLGYAFLWGLATALARIWAYFEWVNASATLSQWLHETVIRFPHFLIPLFVIVLLAGMKNDE